MRPVGSTCFRCTCRSPPHSVVGLPRGCYGCVPVPREREQSHQVLEEQAHNRIQIMCRLSALVLRPRVQLYSYSKRVFNTTQAALLHPFSSRVRKTRRIWHVDAEGRVSTPLNFTSTISYINFLNHSDQARDTTGVMDGSGVHLVAYHTTLGDCRRALKIKGC